jgi:glucosyl-3-phosphoglycerate synthase
MTPLSPPHPALKVSVVLPARNEEDLIGSCLRALALQKIPPEEYEVLLVLDRCTDATRERALEVAGEFPEQRLQLLYGPGEGSGHARRVGMDTACERLLRLGRPHGLISSTDADTVVAPDWLAAQLEAASRSARAIGGRIELADDGSLPQEILNWHAERGRLRHQKVLSEPDNSGRTEHWQFSGASLALTAAVYREIGGLEPRASLEDEHLEQVLRQQGIPIERLLSVRVTTSARLSGRAKRGLAHDLTLAFRTRELSAES